MAETFDFNGQTIQTYEKALKENYLSVWRNLLNIEPSALLSKIKKKRLVSDKLVFGAPVGLSGGFGAGTDAGETPKAGGVMTERFETRSKNFFTNIVISEKAVKLTGTAGAMANALDTEVKGAYATAKWNMGRMLFGNGSGILTTIKAMDAAGNTIAVDDVTYLKKGLIIDIHATGGTVQEGGKEVRIVDVNRSAKTITVTGEPAAYKAGFITVQNSYNNELTGLGAIYDDSVTTLYGVEKAKNSDIKPVVLDAGGDIDDGIITKILREANDEKNSEVDMLLCGNEAYDSYVNYLRTNNVRVEDISHTLKGGFKAIKFIFANREVDVVNEKFVPSKEMWGVDTGSIELHDLDWNFAQLQGGGIFNLMENNSCYRALLTNYGELICTNPGGCVRITNCCI